MINFYTTKEWYAVRRLALIRDRYTCVNCSLVVRSKGTHSVDHIQPVKTHPHLKLELTNLRTLCLPCHNSRHAGRRGGERVRIGVDGFPLDGHWAPKEGE